MRSANNASRRKKDEAREEALQKARSIALAPKILSTVSAGREIVVNGRLALSEYIDKEGTKVIKPVVKLGGCYLCGKKPKAYNAPVKQDAASEAA